MITIDKEKCIGCGSCVKDCFTKELQLVDKKASPKGGNCMECGHCIAVCPAKAISLPGYNMEEVMKLSEINYQLDPNTYLNHLKARRSIRSFQSKPVTEEELQMILDAGRFSPTGGNLQDVSYFVSQKDIRNFKDMLMNTLYQLGLKAKETGNSVSWYSDFWIKLYNQYKNDGIDELFFDAGTVIVISAYAPQEALIAAAHMETMIYSLGLGMLYSGFSNRAINNSPQLQEYLQLENGKNVYAVLVVGYPNVTYTNTVPRKAADVIRN